MFSISVVVCVDFLDTHMASAYFSLKNWVLQLGVQTDQIRLDITDITFVFIFLFKFGFKYR
jgi:hypothetical protein